MQTNTEQKDGAPVDNALQKNQEEKTGKAGKGFLYVTAFFSGMSVMAIELGASRLLAPYFSSSQIVWTVIIGTIMIAMALGNVLGGRMSDKNPDPSRLYKRLLVAALWTAAIPFLGKYIITGLTLVLALFVKSNFLVWASLATCFVLFVFPLMLLGTVTPSLMKFAVTNLQDSGKTVGTISALGTIGSIIGTFLPTFVTIPAVGTSATFLIFAGILALICLIYFVGAKKYIVRGAISLAVIVGLLFAPVSDSFAFWQKGIVYEGESIYNYLQVREDDRSVILSTNVMEGVQSILMKNETLTGMYYDYALAAPLMAGITPKGQKGNSEGGDILILGLGTGTFASLCLEFYEDVRVEGVEIDQKITWLAKEYFRLPDEVEVTVDDGRAYLQRQNTGLYDVIMVDAYQDITIPFQMSSLEFFDLVSQHLKPNGVMVVNMNMRSGKEGAINDYLCDTIAKVFPRVVTVDANFSSNTILFAANQTGFVEQFTTLCETLTGETDFTQQMARVDSGLVTAGGGGRILTDDKAPVELLGMQVMDDIISDTLAYYKSQLEEGGIAELFKLIQ